MNDLAELFARDPLELTKDHEALARMISELRNQRANFMLSGGKAPKAEKKAKQESIDLDSLGDL